jgi:acyl-CoA synthetase (AMP-forming)/AMP-acid ligase II
VPGADEATTYVHRVLARAVEAPAAEILRDTHQVLTAAEFAALVAQLARALEARGLGHGDRIAILAPPSCAAVAIRYAAGVLGCVSMFCPNRGPQAFAHFLDVVDPAVLVVFAQTAPAARYVRVPVVSADELLSAARGLPADPIAVRARPDDLGALATSGGTTGAQKASRRTFGAWERMVDSGPMPERRQLVCLPLAYVSSVHADQTLLAGGTVVFRDGFDAADVLATIEAERITHVGLVEPSLVELADHPDVPRRDLSSLRAISHIGANAPASLRRRLLERIGPVLVHPYGASEVGIISLLAPPEYDLSRPELLGSAGRPLPGIDVRIEAADGSPAPAGEVGAIVVRTPAVADGYAGGLGPVRSPDGAYRPGDLGRLDADGYLHVRGRAADARRIDGRLVLPLDVEEELCAQPGVRYAVALPDPAPDGRFAAAVVLAPGADVHADTLAGCVDGRARIVVVDRIPTTEQGKPDRRELAERLGAVA